MRERLCVCLLVLLAAGCTFRVRERCVTVAGRADNATPGGSVGGSAAVTVTPCP